MVRKEWFFISLFVEPPSPVYGVNEVTPLLHNSGRSEKVAGPLLPNSSNKKAVKGEG